MARHVDPEDDSFRRSLLRALAGGLVAMVVTFAITAVLTQLGGTDEGPGPVVTPSGDLASQPEPSPPQVAATEPGDPTTAPTEPTEPTETIEPTDDVVTVQVLDAVGSGTFAEDAAAALRELGYEVVVVNPTPRRPAQTTVMVTPGQEAEADQLAEQDPRFANIEPNTDFNTAVDLHVLVTDDFVEG